MPISEPRGGREPSPGSAAVATPVHSRLTVLSGPSGVGKSTVVAELRRICPEIWISVSATTRRPRPGEVDGREYHFVDDAEFELRGTVKQVIVAVTQVAQAGSAAQVAQAGKILADTRRALYRILASDGEETDQDAQA